MCFYQFEGKVRGISEGGLAKHAHAPCKHEVGGDHSDQLNFHAVLLEGVAEAHTKKNRGTRRKLKLQDAPRATV